MEALLNILNQPIVIAAFAALVLWALNALYAKKPAWKKYEGTIIAGIKWAEKQIPDNSDNTSVQRLNAAMQYVCKVIEKYEGDLTPAQKAELEQGVQITHAKLEADGNLCKPS
ncbi:MAG: hypothetical protein GXY83_15670 [Rhodopirellula sp.]|nr:hypothetical protein [Rhodopirellula sp.]